MDTKKIVEFLPVKLTREERAQASMRLSQAVDEIDETKRQLDTIKREFKDKDEKLQSEVRHLARKVRTGVEDRAVECEERANWANVTMELFRMDTGEMVNFRPMSREERQREMTYDAPRDN